MGDNFQSKSQKVTRNYFLEIYIFLKNSKGCAKICAKISDRLTKQNGLAFCKQTQFRDSSALSET